MNKVALFHHHFCVGFDMWYKRYVNALKLEWGYGKLWCNVDWCVCCGTECGTLCDMERGRVWSVARNVERCAMWNEVECGLWQGMWNVVRYGTRSSVGCSRECGTLCDVERGRVWAVARNV